MGFSVSGATAIIFVSLLFCFGVFHGAVSNGAERVTSARDSAAEHALDQQNTDINVTELVYDPSSGVLGVAIRNEGSTALSVNNTDLLVDNEYQPPATFTRRTVGGNGATDLWLPGDRLVIELRTNQTPSRVTIATENGLVASEAL